MEKETAYRARVVVLPFDGQGHINPMLQFSKRLASKGFKITVATTVSSAQSMRAEAGEITFEPIYDDCIEGGLGGPGGVGGFIERYKASIARRLPELMKKLGNSENPVKCLVYDANLPWALNLAKQLGVSGVAFFTQSCAAIASYYPVYMEMSDKPLTVPAFSMPGLRQPELPKLLSSGSDKGGYPPIIRIILDQFSNMEKADWILFNSFDKLEEEVLKWMANLWPAVRTIGPTVPSVYLDKRVKGDVDYCFNLYNPDCENCMRWLDSKKPASVVYVSFGSAACLNAEQMTEMAWALRQTSSNFLWVVKATEHSNLFYNFVEETSGKGLVVTWCPQLEVLAHRAIGCFVTHSGWNSTVEAICLGVPVVGMPQFLDQMIDAYLMERVWRVGVQPKVDEKGLATREEIDRCIRDVMHGEEFKKNALRWKTLAKEAVDEAGSSDKHINEIIAQLVGT